MPADWSTPAGDSDAPAPTSTKPKHQRTTCREQQLTRNCQRREVRMTTEEDEGLSDSMRALADAIARLGVKATIGVDELLTVDDLAAVLKIPARTIKDQLAAGLLPH